MRRVIELKVGRTSSVGLTNVDFVAFAFRHENTNNEDMRRKSFRRYSNISGTEHRGDLILGTMMERM